MINSELKSQPNQNGKMIGRIWLEPGISHLNFYTLLYASFFTIASSVFLSFTQPYLFNTILNIPIESQGSLSGRLVLVNEIIVLSLIGPLGVLADKIGRRTIYAAGFFFLFFGYILYPTAENVNQLMIYRMVFALGVACNTAMIATVQADYPQNAWRGKLLGLCGFLQGVGVVIVLSISRGLPDWLVVRGLDQIEAGQASFWIFATVCLINSLIVRIGLKGGVPSSKTNKEPLAYIMKRGLKAGKNPSIALSYAAAFVSRGDLIVVSTFFSLWLVQAGISNGYSPEEALKRGGLFFVIVQAMAVLWAPFAGIIIDRFNRITALSIAMGLASVGYLSLGLISDPTKPIMYAAAIILGMGEINAVLAAQALIGQEAPEDGRGSVVGVFGFFGAIGILIAASLGGYLFDNWMPAGPFVLMGIANFLLMIISITMGIYLKNHYLQKKNN